MRPPAHNEVEVKLRVADVAAMRRQLRKIGARKAGRVFERNVLFDSPDRALQRSGKLLRIRWNNSRAVLTFKAPVPMSAAKQGYKVRREVEFSVASPDQFQAVLAGLGFSAGFQYEKVRTTYRLTTARGLSIELDETPIGAFLELEGPPRQIDRVARRLGHAPADYIVANYFALYRGYCQRRGRPVGHMLFPSRVRKRLR